MPCRRARSFKSRLRIQTKGLRSQTKRSSAMKRWLQAAVLVAVVPVLGEGQTGFLRNSILRPYEATPVPPANFQNSQRIFDLMRAGQLYLSFAGSIALALGKHFCIDIERCLPQ